jgi:two-component system CheB/CheR fusion protein
VLEVARQEGAAEHVLVTAVPIEGSGRHRLVSLTFTQRAYLTSSERDEPGQAELGPTSIEEDRDAERTKLLLSALDGWSGTAADNQRLRTMIEDLRVSKEDLAASREELRTMYGEMERANDRLLVVNAELEAQLFQLKTLSDDVVHLLEGTELAAVFLDREGRIRRFTPAMRELIPLLPGDVGRPLSDFAREFEDPSLDADIARVLATSLSAESVARGKMDRWFLRRVIPCWTERGDVDGAVLTFTDISTWHRSEETLRRSNAELEEHVRQRTAVAVLQQDIAVIANSSAPMHRAFAFALERLCREEPWVGGHVYVVRAGVAEDSVWREDPQTGGRLESALGGFSFAAGEGLVGKVIEDGTARFESKPESDERFARARQRVRGVRSIAVFPIHAGERVVGAFEFFSPRIEPPSATLLEVMRNVGTQIGRVIEREEARERVFELAVEEQRSLGEELHDTLSQQVHGLSMLAQSMVRNLKAEGIAERSVRALVDGLIEAHKQIRVLSNGLVPVRVEAGGLTGALEEMARGWQQNGAECVFEHEGSGDFEDDRVATALYRIAREAARNAVLHGGASRVVVRLVERDEEVTLEVRDDGRGMETVPVDGPGMGLQIMRHRAESVGGTLRIESSPGRGTRVRCRIVSNRRKGEEGRP